MSLAQAAIIIREYLHRLETHDYEPMVRGLRRFSKRRILLALCAVVFFLYVFFSGGGNTRSITGVCVDNELSRFSKGLETYDVGVNSAAVCFVGNGHIGVDSTGEMRVYKNNSLALGVETKFYPVISSTFDGQSSEANITDFRNGILYRIKCAKVSGQCISITSKLYVHRTRRNVVVEEIKVSNPTDVPITVSLSRRSPALWKEAKRNGDAAVFSRTISLESSGVISAAAICTNTPGKLTIHQRREEIIRFACVVHYQERQESGPFNEDKFVESVFSEFKTLELGTDLDNEHIAAWNKLANVSFSLSLSKAPSVLNPDRINATRYILLSNVKAPTLEKDSVQKESYIVALRQPGRCYAGNSNLLFPSRLWKEWSVPENLFKLADLWMLTLSKWGCTGLLKTGAEGVAQAFVLSLSQSSYHDGHLEVGLDAADLHREMSFSGLNIGSSANSSVHVNIRIDSQNRPYLEVSSTSTLYACDGGCLDAPVTLSKSAVIMPVKVTKPQTSILYVAASRKHLEQLRSAIHVSEVGAAPAHEDDVLALHKHGSSPGSMPTSFWVFLGIILLAFHAFLAKLLWTEWRKGDMTPYNPYLRNRYSYSRSH